MRPRPLLIWFLRHTPDVLLCGVLLVAGIYLLLVASVV